MESETMDTAVRILQQNVANKNMVVTERLWLPLAKGPCLALATFPPRSQTPRRRILRLTEQILKWTFQGQPLSTYSLVLCCP